MHAHEALEIRSAYAGGRRRGGGDDDGSRARTRQAKVVSIIALVLFLHVSVVVGVLEHNKLVVSLSIAVVLLLLVV